MHHAGDESGMGGAEPCMMPDCPCTDFTRSVVMSAKQPGRASWTNIDEHGVSEGEARNVRVASNAPGKAVVKWADFGYFDLRGTKYVTRSMLLDDWLKQVESYEAMPHEYLLGISES